MSNVNSSVAFQIEPTELSPSELMILCEILFAGVGGEA